MKKGFTLIETIVAITILTFAVAGPLFTASRAIVAARAASYQLTASYLAQESVEYVRMLRDNHYLAAYAVEPATASTTGWANFQASVAPCQTAPGCAFDPAAVSPDPQLSSGSPYCTSSTCTPLYILLENGVGVYYSQQNLSGSKVTPFVRTIQVFDTGTEERIVSTVKWNFHNTSYTVTVTDHLTPWQSP